MRKAFLFLFVFSLITSSIEGGNKGPRIRAIDTQKLKEERRLEIRKYGRHLVKEHGVLIAAIFYVKYLKDGYNEGAVLDEILGKFNIKEVIQGIKEMLNTYLFKSILEGVDRIVIEHWMSSIVNDTGELIIGGKDLTDDKIKSLDRTGLLGVMVIKKLELDKEESKVSNVGLKLLIESGALYKVSSLILRDYHMDDDNIKYLVKVLRKTPGLLKLWLERASLGDSGAKIIAGVLKYLPLLESLSLANNVIQNRGTLALARELKHVKRLKDFSLKSNFFGIESLEGEEGLFKSLKGAHELKRVEICYNPIHIRGHEQLKAIMKERKMSTEL